MLSCDCDYESSVTAFFIFTMFTYWATFRANVCWPRTSAIQTHMETRGKYTTHTRTRLVSYIRVCVCIVWCGKHENENGWSGALVFLANNYLSHTLCVQCSIGHIERARARARAYTWLLLRYTHTHTYTSSYVCNAIALALLVWGCRSRRHRCCFFD